MKKLVADLSLDKEPLKDALASVDAYVQAGEAFEKVLGELRDLVERDLVRLEKKLEEAGAPWTPGRIPEWRMER